MTAFKSTKYLSILGHPVLKWKVYASIAVALIVACGSIGALYDIMLQNRGAVVSEGATSAPEVAATVPDETPVRALPENYVTMSPLAQLLEKHIRATQLNKVSNYIATGTFGKNLRGQKIVLKARAPNLYKFKTEYPATGVVFEFGYDGEQAWIKGSQSLFSLAPSESDFFASIATMEVSFAHLAWSYRSLAAQEYGLDSVLELLPAEEWRGQSCAVVRSHGILPITMYHYIDTATYREVYRRAKIVKEPGVMAEVGIDFYPPDGGEPYALPMSYQIFIDGTLHDTVKYTHARFNQVILSGIFAAPTDSSFTSLSTRR